MEKISVNFENEYENNNRWFLFDNSSTVESILKKYLKETNSQITLEQEKNCIYV